jgi:hypothetical protein
MFGTQTWRVYVIEIMPRWHELVAPGLPSGKRCFYAGETARSVAERYWEHRTGWALPGRAQKTRARVFSKMAQARPRGHLVNGADLRLQRRMTRDLSPQPNRAAAVALEADVVDRLRSLGHCVYPEGVGTIPFRDYAEHVYDNPER